MIPHFTGVIMDSIVSDPGNKGDFQKYTGYLVLSAALCGIFTGLRGGIFTFIGGRVSYQMTRRYKSAGSCMSCS